MTAAAVLGRYIGSMASLTKKTRTKRRQRHNKMGRRRKNRQALKSTPTGVELFAGCGEPGQPAPAPVAEADSALL